MSGWCPVWPPFWREPRPFEPPLSEKDGRRHQPEKSKTQAEAKRPARAEGHETPPPRKWMLVSWLNINLSPCRCCYKTHVCVTRLPAVTVPAAANCPGMWPGGSLIAIVGQSPLLNIVSHEHSQAQREAEGKHVIPITGNLESKLHGTHEQTSWILFPKKPVQMNQEISETTPPKSEGKSCRKTRRYGGRRRYLSLHPMENPQSRPTAQQDCWGQLHHHRQLNSGAGGVASRWKGKASCTPECMCGEYILLRSFPWWSGGGDEPKPLLHIVVSQWSWRTGNWGLGKVNTSPSLPLPDGHIQAQGSESRHHAGPC